MTFILQAAPAGQAPAGGGWSLWLMLALMFVVMWFFMIRPQRKQQKELEKFRNALKRGDKVVTIGGIYGTVDEIKDKTVVIASKDGKNVFEVEYDNIVNGIGFVPAPVGGKGANIHRVGDCVTIGNLRTAIWRAWDVCMKI